MKNDSVAKLVPLLIVVLLASGSRVALHHLGYANNVAPVTAIAMFLACYRPLHQALFATFAVRFLSDLAIGLFSWPLMIAVYACHFSGVAAGKWIARDTKAWRVLAAPVGTALLFFFVTNFAFFYSFYPHNWSGIMQSYVNALPFFRGTLLGDTGYTLLLFGAYEGFTRLSPTTAFAWRK